MTQVFMVEDALHANAKRMVDQMIGVRVPRDNEPAYLLRCVKNGRYLLVNFDDERGPVTVRKQHAKRFQTRDDAVAERARMKHGRAFRIVRLKLAPPTGGGAR